MLFINVIQCALCKTESKIIELRAIGAQKIRNIFCNNNKLGSLAPVPKRTVK